MLFIRAKNHLVAVGDVDPHKNLLRPEAVLSVTREELLVHHNLALTEFCRI